MTFCQQCGAELHRKRYPKGNLETPTGFASRKYCNKKCMGAAYVAVEFKKHSESMRANRAQEVA